MKDQRNEILLMVTERVYSENPGIQTLMDESTISKRKGVSRRQVFLLFLAVGFIVMGYLNINFLCAKDSLVRQLKGDQEKNHAEFFDARILKI